MLIINGQDKSEAVGSSVREYLDKNGYNLKFVAVECNGDILPKTEYDKKILSDEDCLEVVSFVGGG